MAAEAWRRRGQSAGETVVNLAQRPAAAVGVHTFFFPLGHGARRAVNAKKFEEASVSPMPPLRTLLAWWRWLLIIAYAAAGAALTAATAYRHYAARVAGAGGALLGGFPARAAADGGGQTRDGGGGHRRRPRDVMCGRKRRT